MDILKPLKHYKKRTVVINLSGGVDSTAAALMAKREFPNDPKILCYQDTDAEYLETPAHVYSLAKALEIPLVVLKDDLGFWDRIKQHQSFPLPKTRICTRQLKKDVFNKWVRNNREMLGNEVISIYGFRAEESQGRANMEKKIINPELTLKRTDFTVINYLPVHDMNKRDVIDLVKANGLPLHPCYEFSERCSCWCCIFQPNHVVQEYAKEHPELYETACLVEDEIKHKWKYRFGFNDLMKQRKLF